MRRLFNVGELVTWIPDRFLRRAAPGDYRIIAAMPDRDGEHMYRIKSPLEEYERVVRESLLVKSDGYLPENCQSIRVGEQSQYPRCSTCRVATARAGAQPFPVMAPPIAANSFSMARADGAPSVYVGRLRKLQANDLITPREFRVARERLLDAIGVAAA